MNTLISQQQKAFFHKLEIIQDQFKDVDCLVDQLSYMTDKFEEMNENIIYFLNWKESEEGIYANLLKIDEAQKIIVFQEWEI